jgi:type IV pilus assembly protein PilQ
MILAGPNVLGKSFGAQMSKVYRLNQVSANSAADYLASLGAVVTKVTSITTAVSQGVNQSTQVAGSTTTQQTQTTTQQQVEAYGANTGPLLGMQATTDPRLGTITLVGAPRVVAIAEQYLRQLDLRQRQVALSVKVLDITLNNDMEINNSFAFRWGNNFLVNDSGRLAAIFGSKTAPFTTSINDPQTGVPGRNIPIFGIGAENPGLSYPKDEFFNWLSAQVISRNTKILAAPTLILSENPETQAGGSEQDLSLGGEGFQQVISSTRIGRPRANEAFVIVGDQVFTEVTTTQNENGTTSCDTESSIAGLTFGARVSKIFLWPIARQCLLLRFESWILAVLGFEMVRP